MPQFQNYQQNGSQRINLDGTAGAGLITLQYAFWTRVADAAASGAQVSLFSKTPNQWDYQQDHQGSWFLGDLSTAPSIAGQFTFFHAGGLDAYIDVTIAAAGASEYDYVIDLQTH